MGHRSLVIPAAILAVVTACAGRTMVKSSGSPKAALAELWSPPASPRNLLYGVGGPQLAPPFERNLKSLLG